MKENEINFLLKTTKYNIFFFTFLCTTMKKIRLCVNDFLLFDINNFNNDYEILYQFLLYLALFPTLYNGAVY
jgi:hypothetical protein